MAEFVCKYGTVTGEIVQRIHSAESEKVLRVHMEQQGLHIFSIERKFDPLSLFKNAFRSYRKKLSSKEFLIFNQSLAALIHSGLPLLRCLELYLERVENPEFRLILEDIYQQVKGGTSLSEAFSSHPDVFPRVYTAGILAGEKSGTLEQVIRRYLTYIKIILAIRTKVLSSMIYPSILLLLSVGVIGILVGYVIPQFSEFYKGFASQLPLATQVLVAVALFVRKNVIWFLPLVILAIISIWILIRASEGIRKQADLLKLKIPYVGTLWKKFSVSQLTRTLHTLLAGGIPAVNAIDVAASAVGNRIISEELTKVSRSVKEGEPLWRSLEKTKLMTPMALEMIKVGEETGGLEEMLKNISDFYDEEIETNLTNVLSIVEPVMLIVMGILIAAILLAMYYPLFTVYSTIRS